MKLFRKRLQIVRDSWEVKKMKLIYTLISLCIYQMSFAQNTVSLCSWNLKDFGSSKTDSSIAYIANTIKNYNVVAIQEVVAGYGGIEAVQKLTKELNKNGVKWNYTISNTTTADNIYESERYAFLWKEDSLKILTAGLHQKYNREISREPYLATFVSGTDTFTVVNFHAITKSKYPEKEIKYFKYFPAGYKNLNLIFCGDFNTTQLNSVFNPLKEMGYQPALVNQKTSLSHICINGDYLASEYDNIFYNTLKIKYKSSGVIHFYKDFTSRKNAEKISDHIPVYCTFSFKSN